jgi:hypothetical protein
MLCGPGFIASCLFRHSHADKNRAVSPTQNAPKMPRYPTSDAFLFKRRYRVKIIVFVKPPIRAKGKPWQLLFSLKRVSP